jgi:outer membrane receptor protein involved in Fe transport
LALLPSIGGRLELGAGLAVRAGFSESLRSPTFQEAFTLEDSATAPPATGFKLERGELAESALDYDTGRRLRAEVTFFSEYLHGLGDRRLDGIGGSLVWQVAPLISLRTWSLRDDAADFTTGSLQGDVSRQLLWSTYENPAGLRFDAILTRDAGLVPGAIGLNGDVLIPLVSHAALDLGTSRRDGIRSYVIGLRTR